jgi:hypothetical protein
LDFTSALPTVSDELFAAAPTGARLSVVCCLLMESGAVVAACPACSGVSILSDFPAGAIFSGGAFCCAAGAPGVSSVFMPCAETAQTPSSNIAAVVDINRRVLMDVSCRHSPIVQFCGCVGRQARPAEIVPNSYKALHLSKIHAADGASDIHRLTLLRRECGKL